MESQKPVEAEQDFSSLKETKKIVLVEEIRREQIFAVDDEPIVEKIPASPADAAGEIDAAPQSAQGSTKVSPDVKGKELESPEEMVTEEFDVEKVLENQKSHDLYCPDCKSCITERVILRRRKRGSKTSPIELTEKIGPIGSKRQKLEEKDWVKELAYKCLSCLKIFIPKDHADGMKRLLDSEAAEKGTLAIARLKDFSPLLFGSAVLVLVLSLIVLKLKDQPWKRPEIPNLVSVSAFFFFFVFIILSCLFYLFIRTEKVPRVFGSPKEPQKPQEKNKQTEKKAPSPVSEFKQISQKDNPNQDGTEPDDVVKDKENATADKKKQPLGVKITDHASSVQELIREILKSIVYGGLVQCITSLNAVSSAASSGATTVNIFVLGLTNLIGGLSILLRNLQELKNQTKEGEEDRYKELFGKKENFKLHAFLAVVSFAVFGLVPPIVYALSFQETDNKDHKMLVVSAVSALCIALLAVAKAYVENNPPRMYFNCVVSNLSLGFASSGLTYFAGDFVRGLVEKFQKTGLSGLPDLPGMPDLKKNFQETLAPVVDEMDWFRM